MLEKFSYFVSTFAEAGLAVFGIKGVYEQPAYTSRADLGAGLEIRDYPPAVAVETTASAPTRDEASNTAFGLLFAYIAGANKGSRTIAMTAPVQQAPALIAMTAPVRTDMATEAGQTRVTMRFFLPAKWATEPPVPNDPRVTLTTTQGGIVAALRFSGSATESVRVAKEAELLTRLTSTEWRPDGMPYLLGYDPPFTIPFFKRNEVVVAVKPLGADAR